MQKSLQLEGGVPPIDTAEYNPVTEVTIIRPAITNFDQAEHWRTHYEAQENSPTFTALR